MIIQRSIRSRIQRECREYERIWKGRYVCLGSTALPQSLQSSPPHLSSGFAYRRHNAEPSTSRHKGKR